MTEIRGTLEARARRFAIVAARFNDLVVSKLVEGARDCLRTHGIVEADVDVAWVPGAFEIPLVAGRMAQTGRYDAVICLGAVVRGETPHFEYVAAECARGVQAAALVSGIPVSFGVLTTDTLAQALDRAGGKHGNKGWDAAMAAMETSSVLEQLPKKD